MFEVHGTFVLKGLGDVFEGEDRKGQPYALRSLVVAGDLQLGDQVDYVDRLELVCFKQGKDDKLFAGLATLPPGSRVELGFTLDWSWLKDDRDRRRLVLRPNRVSYCKVLERAPQVERPGRPAAVFVDG